jgi:hypothetical protein
MKPEAQRLSENPPVAGGGIGMKIVATARYHCETCGELEVVHTLNRHNHNCFTCGGTVKFTHVGNIYTQELNGPWVTVEGEEMLKLLVFQMLPSPQKPALASPPP